MRVGLVTQWFPPEPGTHIAAGMATGLAELGHEVDVLTGFPNYPTGRLLDGWSQRPYVRDDFAERVTVHRSPLYPSHDARALHRMANYLTFAASATIAASARLPKPDVWLIYSSPATAALPALLARPGRRAPICLHIQDLWPDSVTGSEFVRGRAAASMDRALHSYTNASYRAASRVGVISPSMKDILVARGVPADKIDWVPNWVPEGLKSDPTASRAQLGLPDGPVFLYAGNMGQLQGLRSLVDAFADVPEAQLVLMGDGVERDELARVAAVAPRRNVHVLPAVAGDRVGQYLAAADVLVVSLLDTPLLRATMPSKVQSCLAAGKPIFVHGAGDVAEVVIEAGAGASARPGQHDRVTSTVRSLASRYEEWPDMGRRALQYYEKFFAPATGIRRLERMVQSAVNGRQQ